MSDPPAQTNVKIKIVRNKNICHARTFSNKNDIFFNGRAFALVFIIIHLVAVRQQQQQFIILLGGSD